MARCMRLDVPGAPPHDTGRCALDDGHEGGCVALRDVVPVVELCAVRFTRGAETVICTLLDGHQGEHDDATIIEAVDRRLSECTYEVDIDGRLAHCILVDGHRGPHAVGVAPASGTVCGETERGTGRTCLRQPHTRWPDAHDYGPPDTHRQVPDWWVEAGYSGESWPGGPIGTAPDQLRWFYPAQRPADDLESKANRHDVKETIARRHKAPGVMYGEDGPMASIGEVRDAITRGIQYCHDAQTFTTVSNDANQQAQADAGHVHVRIGDFGRILAQMKQDMEEALITLAALIDPNTGKMAEINMPAGGASDNAGYAENVFAHAAEGGSGRLNEAIASAASAKASFDESIGGVVIATDRFQETFDFLRDMQAHVEAALVLAETTENRIESGRTVLAAIQGAQESAYAATQAAVESAQDVLGAL